MTGFPQNTDSTKDQPERDDRIYRHGRLVRITHWINAAAIIALLVTGLGITHLYAPLHWGDAGQDWGPMGREINGAASDPYPAIGRAPSIPYQDLRRDLPPVAETLGLSAWINEALWSMETYLHTPMRVRDHITIAWLFLFNGLVYLAAGFYMGRFRTILRPSWRELSWRQIGHELWSHALLRFPKGDEARSYNLIQKYTYLFMIFVVLPFQLITGLILMPWMDAALPWLKDLFLGRQSVRTMHFTCSILILAFIIVHLAMVVLSGFRNNMRSMITGWYKLPR